MRAPATPLPPGTLADLGLDEVFLAEEHRALRAVVRRFVEREVTPLAEAWEEARRVPPATFRRLGQVGLLGLSFPTEVGGGGAGVRGAVVLSEELALSGFGGFSTSVTTHADFSALHLVRAGTRAQQARWLPGVLSGETISGLAVTEPEASSDLTRLTTRARPDGDDWVLDGHKTFITHANLGDLFFLVARTGGPGRDGLSLFVVERGTPGLANGRVFHKTGWRCSDTGELVLTGCRVPASALLGAPGDGFALMMAGLDHERICLAAQAVGLAESALSHTLAWVRQRPAYGGQLWDKQVVRHRLADQSVRLAAAKTLLYHAAAAIDAGRTEPHSQRRYAAMLKAHLPTLANEIASSCAQLLGGSGFVEEGPVERIARDTRFLAVGGGATEVMLDEVARLL